MPVLVGQIRNDHNSLVLAVAIDGAAAPAWQGSVEDPFAALLRGEDTAIELAGIRGVLLELGGGGFANVYRVDEDELVLLEHVEDADPVMMCKAPGTAKSELGTLEVTSGVLALLHSLDPGEEEGPHVFAKLRNGRYVLTSDLVQLPGPIALDVTRVRVARVR